MSHTHAAALHCAAPAPAAAAASPPFTCSPMEYDEQTRWLAVEAWWWAHGNSEEAVRLLRAWCADRGWRCPRDAAGFVHQWVEAYNLHHSVATAPGRGRHTQLDPALVDAAYTRFAAGYTSEAGILKHWPTFEMAARCDPGIKALLAASGVTARTLFDHMRQASWALHCTPAAQPCPSQRPASTDATPARLHAHPHRRPTWTWSAGRSWPSAPSMPHTKRKGQR